MHQWLNFGGDPDYRLDTGIVFGFVTIGRYREWLTDKSAAHTDLPDGVTGKTCLGRGMHCLSASSLYCVYFKPYFCRLALCK